MIRQAQEDEKLEILKEGYKHFPKNRSIEDYIKDNSREDVYGKRYVLVKRSTNSLLTDHFAA